MILTVTAVTYSTASTYPSWWVSLSRPLPVSHSENAMLRRLWSWHELIFVSLIRLPPGSRLVGHNVSLWQLFRNSTARHTTEMTSDHSCTAPHASTDSKPTPNVCRFPQSTYAISPIYVHQSSNIAYLLSIDRVISWLIGSIDWF